MDHTNNTAQSVFITGASSGLGRQMAIEFARRGYRLALTARRLDVLQALQAELLQAGAPTVFVAALDVTDSAAVAQVFGQACSVLGRFDIVVANAGIGNHGRIGQLPLHLAHATMATNVLGFMSTVDAALQHFRAVLAAVLTVPARPQSPITWKPCVPRPGPAASWSPPCRRASLTPR